MPIYSIQTPSGRTLDIEADDEATAMAGAQQWQADVDAVVQTTWGEARNDPDSQAGVASVIVNRANLTGRSPRDVVTEQGQFEPWSDPEQRRGMEGLTHDSEAYQAILGRILPALNGEDVTGGATHFYAPKAQAALGRDAPSWDDGSGVDMGLHRFFKRPGDFSGAPAEGFEDSSEVGGVSPEGNTWRRNPDGSIEIDINTSTNPDFLREKAEREAARAPTGIENTTPAIRAALADYQRRRHQADGATADDDVNRAAAAANGMLFGLLGPLAGAGNALNVGARSLGRRLTGQEPLPFGMSEAFDAGRLSTNELMRKYAAEKPVESVAVGVGGGIVSGGPLGKLVTSGVKAPAFLAPWLAKLAGGRTLAPVTSRSALAGAGVGALSGAGGADPGDELERAREGAVFGTGVGALAPAATAGLAKTALGLSSGAQSMLRRFGGNAPAETPAEMSVASAIERVITRDGGTPEKLLADISALPVDRLPFEAGGDNLRAVAEVLAQAPGSAKTLLTEALKGRTPQATRDRVLSSVEEAAGLDPSTMADDFAGMAKALRAKAAPLYDEAYAGGPINSDKLEELAKRPSMKDAIARAISIAQEEGRDPKALGLTNSTRLEARPGTKDDWQVVKRDRLTYGWSPQTWDYVKRGLDDVIETYRDKTTRRLNLDEAGRAKVATLKEMRQELIEQNPKYGEALAAGGEPLQLEEAFRDAPRLMSNAVPERVFEKRWTEATPAQKEAWRGGWLNDTFERTRSGKMNLRDLQAPAYQAKLRTVFGDDAATMLTQAVEEALDMQGVSQKVLRGSPTMARTEAADDLKSQPGVDGLDLAGLGLDIASMNPIGMSSRALKEVVKRLPRRDRSVVGDPVKNRLMGQALTEEDEMTRLLNLLQAHRARKMLQDQRFRRAGASALPGVTAGAQPLVAN